MATIGYLTHDTDNDRFAGYVKTLMMSNKIALQRIGKRSDKAPDYRITAENGAEVGAAWIRNNQNDKEYVSLTIDDPSLPHPIYANLGRAADQDDPDTYAIIWSRPGT